MCAYVPEYKIPTEVEHRREEIEDPVLDHFYLLHQICSSRDFPYVPTHNGVVDVIGESESPQAHLVGLGDARPLSLFSTSTVRDCLPDNTVVVVECLMPKHFDEECQKQRE